MKPFISLAIACFSVFAFADGKVLGPGLRVKDVPDQAMAVAKEADRLYVAAGSELSVFDISCPLEPHLLGRFEGVDNRRQLVVRNGIAYLVSRETGMRIIDCRDPRRPQVMSRMDTIEFATGIDVVGSVAFVSERIYGVEFVDVSDPKSPVHIAVRKTGESQSNRYHNGYLYSGEWGGGSVRVFDVHDLSNIRDLGKVRLHGFGDGLEIDGNYLYCSTGHDAKCRPEWKGEEAVGRGRGMDIFSLDDPAKPKHVGRVDFPRFKPRSDDYWTVRVSAGRKLAFCADSHNGLFVVDVENPGAPKLLDDRFCVPQPGHDWPSGAISSLAIGEGCIYVTSFPGGLWVVPVEGIRPSVRDPGPPPKGVDYREPYPTDESEFFVYRPERLGQARTAVVRGDLVYAAFGDAGLQVLRVDPKRGFEKVGELPGRKVYDCCFAGDRLVTAEGLDGFAVYSLGDGPVAFKEEQRRTRLSEGATVAFWCWSPDPAHVFLCGRNTPKLLYPVDDINRVKALLKVSGTCNWDKYLAGRAIGGRIPDLVPHRGMQWLDLSGKPKILKMDLRLKNAGQTCGVCAFGDAFLATCSDEGAIAGAKVRSKIPCVAFSTVDQEFGPSIPVPGGLGVPRSDGRLVGMNNRSSRRFFLYDFRDREHPTLVRKWNLSGNPDVCAFYEGRVVIPAGYQGLLLQKTTCATRRDVDSRKR